MRCVVISTTTASGGTPPAVGLLEDYIRRREGRTKVLLGYFKVDEPLHIVANVRRFETNFEARVEVVRPEPPKWTDERTRGMR